MPAPVLPHIPPLPVSAVGASKFHAAVELARLLLPPVLLGLAMVPLADRDLSEELFGKVVIDPAIHGSTIVPVTSLMFADYFVIVSSAGHFSSPKAVDVFLKTGLPAAPYAVAGGAWVIATFTAWVLARRSGLEEVLSELEERFKDNLPCLRGSEDRGGRPGVRGSS